MAELTAASACAGLLPLSIGGMCLSEEHPGPMWSLAPFKSRRAALGAAMEAAHGAGFPDANRSVQGRDAEALWFGREVALLIGAEPDEGLAAYAALTDQSDAWAVVRLEGAGAEDVLARLVPVDLRARVFPPGHTVRCALRHMMASVTCMGPQVFRIMVFRSMAQTVVDDLKTAMEALAARE